MARHTFGGTLAAFVVAAGNASGPGFETLLIPNVTITFWNQLSGGTQYTDLLDSTGTAISSVTTDSKGNIPEFQGPDSINLMYADAGEQRQIIVANDIGQRVDTAQETAKSAQDTANEALNAVNGEGTGSVDSVNGKTGDVVLDAADVDAVNLGPDNQVDLAINDQWLAVNIADEDNLSSPNRMVFQFQGNPTSWFNEYGELRVQAARRSTTPFKLRARDSSGQTNDFFRVERSDRTALAGFRSDGQVFGPNIGTSGISSRSSPPSSPMFGDLWVDMAQSPPVLKVWNGSQWVPIDSSGGSTAPPDHAPAFVDATSDRLTFESVPVAKPMGDTLLAMVSWSTTDDVSAPVGWSLVKELTVGSGRSGVWVADSSVTDTSWETVGGTAAKWAYTVLGYESCSVSASASSADTSRDTAYTSPALSVPTAPARVVRMWAVRTSTAPSFTPPSSVTERAAMTEDGGGGAMYAYAGDEEQTSTGVASSVDLTSTVSSPSHGYTVSLVLQ